MSPAPLIQQVRPVVNANLLPTTILINGQSNAAAGPPPPRGLSPLTRFLGSDLLGFDQATQDFATLSDGFASSRTLSYTGSAGAGAGQWGTLLMRRLADATQQTIRCYALAFTSQAISYFLPTSVTNAFFSDGTQHPTLNNYDLLKSYVDASGIVPELYIWWQGEANAGDTQAEYYAPLKTIFDQTRKDYPSIRWLIIGTIGDAQDRIGGPVTGVRAAQQQLADENPGVVSILKNTDMSQSSAYFDSPHYTTFAGHEELGERVYALINGEARPDVTPGIGHIANVLSWTNLFTNTFSVVTAPETAGWQSDISPNPLMTPSGANGPEHIPFDPDFGNRSSVEFDRNNSETLRIAGMTAATDWTLFCVAMVDDNTVATQYLMIIQDAGNANRLGVIALGTSTRIQAFYDAIAADFTPNPFIQDDVRAKSYCMVHDSGATTMTLYVDGVLFGTYNTAGTEANMTDFWIGSLIGTSIIIGKYSAAACVRNVLATAEQAAAMHAWAKVEFDLAG